CCFRCSQLRIKNYSERIASSLMEFTEAHAEVRIIIYDRIGTDENCREALPEKVRVHFLFFSADPHCLRIFFRHKAVFIHGHFERDEWFFGRNKVEKIFIQIEIFPAQLRKISKNFHPVCLQFFQRFSGDFWVWISEKHINCRNFFGDQEVDAWWRAAEMRARFERHKYFSACDRKTIFLSSADRIDLSMRFTVMRMPAAADDLLIFYDDASHQGIWCRKADATVSKFYGEPQKAFENEL